MMGFNTIILLNQSKKASDSCSNKDQFWYLTVFGTAKHIFSHNITENFKKSSKISSRRDDVVQPQSMKYLNACNFPF